ncbi:hypothetical protein ACHAXR_009898 [Thalassiosira sp. AJA248-18]
MVAKIKKRIKLPQRREKKAPAAVTISVDPVQDEKDTLPIKGCANNAASPVEELSSQLREHINQGRIFDARSIVHKLNAECNDPGGLKPVRHLMDEVISQSKHVEDLLHELHSNDDWTLAKQKSGVTVHFRREQNSPIHTVRAATTFDNFSPKDFVRLCSLFVETECMHLWFPGGVMKPANLLSWHSKYSKVIQLNISLGLPMISSRDAIVLGNGYHLPDRNAFLISTKTILEDTCRYCDIPKPNKGTVRMATESIFYMELVKKDVVSFKMIGRDDLKLKYMPSTLLNFISQGHLPFDLMRTIHRTIRKFESSVWEKKIEERGAYYTEIEDKVHVQLQQWEKEGKGDPESTSKRSNDKLAMQQSAKVSPLSTNYYSGKEDLNNPVNGSEVKAGRRLMALVLLTEISTLFASALYFTAFPETASILAPTLVDIFSVALPAKNVLLATGILLLLLPFMMLISLISIAKRPRENHSATESV